MKTDSTFSFEPASKEKYCRFISLREGETKLGESIVFGQPAEDTRFIILGIEESIGPQANNGLPGAENAFRSFIQRFLNMQANRFIKGNQIALIGTIKSNSPFTSVSEARERVIELDELVSSVLRDNLSNNSIPIIVGGGHNNAYPIIRSVSENLKQPINVINLDPHSDCRPLEGRHSGNPFSSAKKDGSLEHYSVLGLHKAYNSEYLLNYLDLQEFTYTFYDDYLNDPEKFRDDVKRFNSGSGSEKPFGVELDLDSIAGMPSSAFTPSGIDMEQARYYIKHLSKNRNAVYFHFPEGAPTTPFEEKIVGKALAYLVWDVIS